MLKQPNKRSIDLHTTLVKVTLIFNIIIGKFKNPNQYGEFIYYHDDDSENKTSGYYIKNY
jgi:hypothetical protein